MDRFKVIIAIFSILLLMGCATTPQPSVPLVDAYWESSDQKVGVYVQSVEKPEFYMEGDVRLLDFAVNSATMSSLKKHLAGLDVSDYESLREQINKRFLDQGKSVTLLIDHQKIEDFPTFEDPNKEDAIYYSAKDYSSLKKKYMVDQLLVIVPKRVGVARPYYGFMPMGDPRAVFEVHGELVDLETNQLLWYADVLRANYSSGKWDEPPTYPGLTNSFYAALEAAKQEVLTHLQRNVE
jgi:hypothetical protein